jgi:hypothetical protein
VGLTHHGQSLVWRHTREVSRQGHIHVGQLQQHARHLRRARPGVQHDGHAEVQAAQRVVHSSICPHAVYLQEAGKALRMAQEQGTNAAIRVAVRWVMSARQSNNQGPGITPHRHWPPQLLSEPQLLLKGLHLCRPVCGWHAWSTVQSALVARHSVT